MSIIPKHWKQQARGIISRACLIWGSVVEATGGFEPPNRGFADLRLRPLGYVALFTYAWCRGGDSNSYSLAATAPSTLRVYQFHHLGLSHCHLGHAPVRLSGWTSVTGHIIANPPVSVHRFPPTHRRSDGRLFGCGSGPHRCRLVYSCYVRCPAIPAFLSPSTPPAPGVSMLSARSVPDRLPTRIVRVSRSQ